MIETKKENLMSRVSDYRNIHLAYLRVKNGSINKELRSIKEIEHFEKNIPQIYDEIKQIIEGKKEFEFSNLYELRKPKSADDIEGRPLVKINFFDEVLTQCFTNILANEIAHALPLENYGLKVCIQDSKFQSPFFYSHWKNQYSKFINAEIVASNDNRYEYYIEADIKNFYATVNLDTLIKEIKSHLDLGIDSNGDLANFINWMNKILTIKVVSDGGEVKNPGLPQGVIYSPLLAAFYIRNCFNEIEKNFPEATCFGYVDDLRIYCASEDDAKRIFEILKKFMGERKLQLNKDKTGYYKINNYKKFESRIMGKASNIDRAIRDDIILESSDVNEIILRLRKIVNEVEAFYSKNLDEPEYNTKFKEKIEKFVDYRIIKILNDTDEWERYLDQLIHQDKIFKINLSAIIHALFIGSKTYTQKRKFMDKMIWLIENTELTKFNYIKFVALSYLFKWTPIDLKFSEKHIEEYLDKAISTKAIYMEVVLNNINESWLPYLSEHPKYVSYLQTKMEETLDSEMISLLRLPLYDLKLNKPEYKLNKDYKKLVYTESELSFTFNDFNLYTESNYLTSESYKNITYKLFEYSNGTWIINLEKEYYPLIDMKILCTENELKSVILDIFQYLYIQLKIYKSHLPCSIIHPEYIWVHKKENEQGNKILINLYGNPAFKMDLFYLSNKKNIWRECFIEFFETVFNVSTKKKTGNCSDDIMRPINLWKYRIINYLLGKNFSVITFIEFVIAVMNEKNEYIDSYLDYHEIRVNHLLKHYIQDKSYLDNLIQISQFVKNSWKNGAKDCNFFTLHNQEHSIYLINRIHEILQSTGFSIYVNTKEAFRLFAACYLHDIGMLTAPRKIDLFDKNKNKDLTKKSKQILRNMDIGDPKASVIYDLHKEVQTFREEMVRKKHALVSHDEIIKDYPKLPLTTAERRDIGELALAHDKSKDNIDKDLRVLYDGTSPINMKLLALLLRLADLTDVSKDRVSIEILERNYEHMSNITKFNWIKHLSTEGLKIEVQDLEDFSKPTVVNLIIEHNYLPFSNLEKKKDMCGEKCKKKFKDEGFKDTEKQQWFSGGKGPIYEHKSEFKYFEKNQCNATCAFINESYKWFYTEIIYLNRYLKQNNIDVIFDVSIKYSSNFRKDFYFVKNRNFQKSSQEFMIKFFNKRG